MKTSRKTSFRPHDWNVFVHSPAQGADSVLGLVASIVLVLSSGYIQETVHHGHTLVEALGGELGQVAPGGHALTGVSPLYLGCSIGYQSQHGP